MNKLLTAVLVAAMLAVAWFTSSTWVEIAATATGLISVWFTAKENLWAWPAGLVNVALSFYTFLEVKLYADMTLQAVFFVLSVYGWYYWLTQRGGGKVRPTRRLAPAEGAVAAVALLVVTIGWGYVLKTYTDAAIPYADALVATLSLIAQYFLSSKVLENWFVWIAVDMLSIGMYAYKGLYLFTFLYVVYLGIAIGGLIGWRREFARGGGVPHERQGQQNWAHTR